MVLTLNSIDPTNFRAVCIILNDSGLLRSSTSIITENTLHSVEPFLDNHDSLPFSNCLKYIL